MNLTPRDAAEALRLAKCAEAAIAGDFTIWPEGNGVVALDSWKTDANGKRTFERYTVNLEAWSCSCEDFKKRGKFCKHLLRSLGVSEQEAEDFAADAQAAEYEESNRDFFGTEALLTM